MSKRKKSILIPTMFLTIALTLFLAGFCFAGSLEPSDPPGPTMNTLEEIYNKPVWKMFDKAFVDWPANPRFAVCENGTTDTRDDMVLDKETGLVWARDPNMYYGSERTLNWYQALHACSTLYLGDRGGWHMPTVQELSTLADGTQYAPTLPAGHPFINVQWDFIGGNDVHIYWTATAFTSDPSSFYPNYARILVFYSGLIGEVSKSRTIGAHVWCVRGGQGADPQVDAR